jgi:predicted transport protein
MTLEENARRLLSVAERLRGPFGNAANTRALLVEPMLSALGWDTTDVEQVVREWPLGNGTASYALMDSDAPMLFIEVRGVDAGIREADSGLPTIKPGTVQWLALTDGISYRIFTAPETESGEPRLICSAELGGVASGSRGDTGNLALLSRESVLDGSLQESVDRLFADPRVREALVDLTRNPSPVFLSALRDAVGAPVVREAALRAALQRVFDADPESKAPIATHTVVATPIVEAMPAVEATPPAIVTTEPGTHDGGGGETPPPPWLRPSRPSAAPAVGGSTPGPTVPATDESPQRMPTALLAPGESNTDARAAASPTTAAAERPHLPFGNGQSQYPLVDFLAGKPSGIVEIFEQLDGYALSLGPDLTRRVNADYVEYLRDRTSRFTLELYQHRIIMHVWLDPAAIQAWWWAEDATRHMIDVRDRGADAAEYSISDAEQLPDAKELVRLAYSGFPERRV